MGKKKFTPTSDTRKGLEESFMTNPRPTKLERQQLATVLDAPIKYINNWFPQRRYQSK